MSLKEKYQNSKAKINMITPIEPIVNASSRYSIGEAAKILGVHRNSILNYTKAGLLKCGIRKATKRKFYTGLEILKFWRTSI